MVLTALAVFLFGTAVSAGPFIPHVKAPTEIIISKHSSADKATEYYPPSGGSPFISNFIQKGTNVFFKPQFMLSAAQMPPQVQTMIAAIEKDDCKTTLPMGPIPMFLEEPLRLVQQEFDANSEPITKEVIEINPVQSNQHVKPIMELTPPVVEMQVMELPIMPEVFEESAKGTPCPPGVEEHIVIPEAPVLPPYEPQFEYPESVVIKTKKEENVLIPLAPELPQLELPKSPVLVEEIPHPPLQEVAEIPAIVEIPPAPILRPLETKLPVLVEETVISSPPEENVESNINPQEISEVTVVPSFIPKSYIRVVNQPPAPNESTSVSLEAPKPHEENLAIKPIEIPTAPMLPPFEMPKLSVMVEKSSEFPCLPGEEKNEINIIQPLDVPEAPILSPYVPELPKIVIEENLLGIPQPPEHPLFVAPELPIGVVLEEVVSEKVSGLPCEEIKIIDEVRPMIPEAPVLSSYIPVEIPKPILIEEPGRVEVENKFLEPVAIPAAPLLPPFNMPELPVVIEESSMVPCPSNEVNISPPIVPEVIVTPPDVIAIEENHKVVPEAPKLPPFLYPELPVKIEDEENVMPCDIVEAVEPLVIPEAPVFTPYVPHEMPIPVLFEKPISVEIENPTPIPAAPVLPPFEMLEAPITVEESVSLSLPTYEFEHKKLIIESRPDELPVPYTIPESYISDISKRILLASAPEYLVSYFPVATEKVLKEEPASCVHDILVERILPKSENSLSTAAKVPVSAYLTPLRYALY